LIVFFALSGIWQMLGYDDSDGWPGKVMRSLSTIHHARGVKDHEITSLNSLNLKWLSVAMAASLILNIVLGVAMAFRFGHKRVAMGCLAVGLLVPVILAWIAAH
jgi:hypothetical protein